MDEVRTPLPPPPEGRAEATITHRGRVYGIGFDDDSFAVWPLAGGGPLHRSPRTEAGWREAWARFQALDRRDAIPGWRRPVAGWILVHVALALVLWFSVIVLDVLVLSAAGHGVDEVTDTTSAGLLIALPMAIGGWVSFVYLKRRALRWSVLAALLGGALVVALAFGFAGQPAS